MSGGGGGGLLSTAGAIGGGFLGAPLGPAGIAAGASLGGMLGGAIDGALAPQQEASSGVSPGEDALMQRLNAQALGQGGPSPAELQLAAAMQKANANSAALAASQRGINPALASRLAMTAQSQNNQNLAQQGGILRAQETQQANDLMGRMFASQRGSQLQATQLNQQNNQFRQQQNNNLLASAGNAALTYYTGQKKPETDGGQAPAAMASGGVVPGKAKVFGDNKKNDVVPAKLSPGEMVIPRTIVSAGPEAIAAFAQALLKMEGSNV
jgi:hypothetical protein